MRTEDAPPADDLLTAALADAPETPVCVGFSGGLDSSVLLHLLAGQPAIRQRGLRALHVHHGLHDDADAWARHCQDTCDGLGIPLTIAQVRVEQSGDGPEAAARSARHAAFETDLGAGEVLALAHHREDQAETFLLRALRASGTGGLGAMRRTRPFGRGTLWRPLLDASQAAIGSYARRHGLSWIEDPSNQRTDLDRNFLRHRILPLLRERWPQVDSAFARSAGLCAGASDLLSGDDAAVLDRVLREDRRSLDVVLLKPLAPARRARVLRRWIETLGLPPLPAKGLTRIESDLLAATADTHAQFVWAGTAVHRWREQLHARPCHPPLPADWQAHWNGHDILPLPGGGSLSLVGAAGFDTALRVHARQGGERLRLQGRQHSHALKHLLQEQDVPPWQRLQMPLVSDGDTLLAAGDVLLSATFGEWLHERGARLSWARPA